MPAGESLLPLNAERLHAKPHKPDGKELKAVIRRIHKKGFSCSLDLRNSALLSLKR
jgi:hypothetical protein